MKCVVLTGTEQGLALGVVVLAHAVVAVSHALQARVSVLLKYVGLAQRGRTVTVLRQVAFICTAPAHETTREELREGGGGMKGDKNLN